MLRKDLFIIAFASVVSLVVLGIANNEALTAVAKAAFLFSLRNFGWLYQITAMGCFILVLSLLFSKFGGIRLGGETAKPQFSMLSWFALALTGGIASGLITYGVNEPIIYYGNVYGVLSEIDVKPQTEGAFFFAIARSFYNWSFVAYTFYTLSGLLIAYLHFNFKKRLTVSDCLSPVFGNRRPVWLDTTVDLLVLLAIVLGTASSLGAGLTLISSGLDVAYAVKPNEYVWLAITLVITAIFTLAAVTGLGKGIKKLADANMWLFYGLLLFLLLIGPTRSIVSSGLSSLGLWLDHFWQWGLDDSRADGEALVMWWTLYDWAIWIAFAPLMGLFLARIAYGRTIRQFILINWILPSVFALIWFSVWGVTALEWQVSGKVDLVQIIKDSGAVAGLWGLLKVLPASQLLIPLVIVTLIISFSTAADAVIETIAGLCVKDNEGLDSEPPKYLKLVWGALIGSLAYLMVAYAGGSQGVDGVKYLAAAGGFIVLWVFLLQVLSLVRALFLGKTGH